MSENSEAAPPRRARPDAPDEAGRMSLADHLIELRKRLLISFVAVFIMTIVGFMLWKPILDFMIDPYCRLPQAREVIKGDCNLFAFDILGELGVRLKVAMIGGIILAGPIWLYQLWAFIAPGLHRKERRWAFWFIAVSFLLFVGGTAFAYYTLDKGLEFLLGIGGDRVANLVEINKYFGFVTLMLLAFGVSFEFPLILVVLNIAGVLPTQRMQSSRRIVAFGIALFAAIITPTQDPFTFAAMAGPMYIFFEAAIVFGRIRDAARRRRAENDPLAQLADDEMSQIDDRPSEIDERPSRLEDLDLDEE
ncbi:MAG: twin-arginine translocase subunit TatC [Mycobacteriales bacterium]